MKNHSYSLFTASTYRMLFHFLGYTSSAGAKSAPLSEEHLPRMDARAFGVATGRGELS